MNKKEKVLGIKVLPALECAKEQLNQIAAIESPFTVLKQVNYVFFVSFSG